MTKSNQKICRKSGRFFLPVVVFMMVVNLAIGQEEQPAYKNTELSIEERVEDLVSRMTLEEKISQMSHLAPAIPRLDIEAYDPIYSNPLNPDQAYNEELIGLIKQYRP